MTDPLPLPGSEIVSVNEPEPEVTTVNRIDVPVFVVDHAKPAGKLGELIVEKLPVTEAAVRIVN